MMAHQSTLSAMTDACDTRGREHARTAFELGLQDADAAPPVERDEVVGRRLQSLLTRKRHIQRSMVTLRQALERRSAVPSQTSGRRAPRAASALFPCPSRALGDAAPVPR